MNQDKECLFEVIPDEKRDSETARKNVVSFRMSDNELQKIDTSAEANGLGRTNFLRSLISVGLL